ncbi:DUF6773 family protein [Haloimpatiens sp. FM7330]|uniref:DUF6773 family protein n=1 Tax=Haloimpatiens sp. FM7330 TaxID=3298610 RepID=UPI0036349A53
MDMNKLDERQLQKRNKIGNQSFLILFWLLTIDVVLYGLNIRWLEYPINIFLIMSVCVTYYIVRSIWASAYVGVTNNTSKGVAKKITSFIIFAVFSAVVSVFINKNNLIKIKATSSQDSSVKFLFIASLVMVCIVITISIFSYRRDKKNEEE